MITVVLLVWSVIVGVVATNTVKDIKMDKAVAQFDQQRVKEANDRELEAYIEQISVLRDGKTVHQVLEVK